MGYIKKADYIEKFGIEAWNTKAEKRKEYMKQWKEAHPDYDKQYYRDNVERISKKNKRWRENNPEYNSERNMRWREAHPDYDIQHHKRYYQDNRERIREYYKQYYEQRYNTPYGRAKNMANNYIKIDKKKGFSTDQNIDADWLIDNIFNSSCVYCGDSDWTHLGADRIDNTKGHIPDNCVCACGLCNVERNDNMSVDEFKEYRKTHPRKLGGGIEKSWEIVEQNGLKVIKKKIG